ncbi:MAG: heavy metal sensor histidine kinase [Burkholderiales bacterium]|jgi:two-component system heavy metal sensor histidine kinase CusS|nr:heavy metal sensor histidine kinase [Burkholderiales bacterium]
MWRGSITFRLALYFAVVSIAVLVSIGYVVGDSMERHFVDLDRAELYGKLALVRHALSKVRTPGDIEALPDRMDDALTGHEALSVRISRPDGTQLFSVRGAAFPKRLLEAPPDATQPPPLASWTTGDRVYHGVMTRAGTEARELPEVTVAIALNTNEHHRFMMVFYRNLWVGIALGIVAAAMLGWIAAKRGLAPVREMTGVAQRVTASRLDDRIPLTQLPVELRDLAAAFNDMLSRLEDSFRRLSDFSSDLAHELRTPIGNMMTQTQVALSRVRSADEYREVLYSNAEEFERLARMISDMLFLAKADNGLIVPRREAFDLESEVRQLFEFYDALAEDRGVSLVLTGDAVVSGERLMIRRAVSNLLSNAITHTARGEAVNVRIERTGSGETKLSVENRGEGIDAEHLERIFDRFYRVDPSRQRLTDGAGLGLAITKSIVAAHQGTIRASSSNGSTRFEIHLPEQAPPTCARGSASPPPISV